LDPTSMTYISYMPMIFGDVKTERHVAMRNGDQGREWSGKIAGPDARLATTPALSRVTCHEDEYQVTARRPGDHCRQPQLGPGMSAPPSGKAGKATPRKPLPYPGPRPGHLAAWPDPSFLPAELRAHLVELLRDQGIDDAQAAAFVSECSRTVHFMHLVRERSKRAQVRDELEHVAKKAHETLLAMNRLSVDGWERLREEAAINVEWPDSVLAVMDELDEYPIQFIWDIIAVLEATALQVACNIDVQRRHRSAEDAAKELSFMVARQFFARFGWFPSSDQNGWFVDFMRCMGQHIGVTCGPRPVASGMKEARDAVKQK